MDTAVFSAASLFHTDDDSDDDARRGKVAADGESQEQALEYEERLHKFPGLDLSIREFSCHQLNANLLWPGTFFFAAWLAKNPSVLEGQRILELGRYEQLSCAQCSTKYAVYLPPIKKKIVCIALSIYKMYASLLNGTGALAIFLRKTYGVDITTSDYDDKDIEENIAHNCRVNNLDLLPHIRHTWGDPFPVLRPDWNIVIASDILLYVKQYPNLIKTLSFLLKESDLNGQRAGCTNITTKSGEQVVMRYPMFLMSWRRRIGKDQSIFFEGCEKAGLEVQHLGDLVYLINKKN
ncbi:hypothetical protein ACQ4PT_046510 [Festuca glaucescens]